MQSRPADDTYHVAATATSVQHLTRSWWLLLLRGIAGILFGIAAFVWPGLTVLVLTLLYGAFAFADGILSVLFGLAVLLRPGAGALAWAVGRGGLRAPLRPAARRLRVPPQGRPRAPAGAELIASARMQPATWPPATTSPLPNGR